MQKKSITYHTRLNGNDSTKICGGSFGGAIDQDTANRLVNTHFDVIVKASGHPVFVDREGREVRLYLTVDPGLTTKGAEALRLWRAEKARQAEADERLEESQQEELAEAMAGLSHEEIIRRLRQVDPTQ